MAVYEGITTDRLTVVIDIGTAFTNGEHAPRYIIRSEVKSPDSNEIRQIHSYKNEEDLYKLLVEFLHVIYFKYILLSPKDKPLIIVESMLCSTIFRDTLAKVLFNHYEISSLFVAPSHLVSLAPLALSTALVVDVGYLETVVIPVCHGLPILHAWQALPVASESIHGNLRNQLISCNTGISNIKETVLEDIKVRCCFVTPQKRAIEISKSPLEFKYCPDVEYQYGGSKVIYVTGKIRETAAECLFEEDGDKQCLPTMVLEAVLKVNVDLRVRLAENILLIGGTAMIPGFKARFKDELYKQLKTERYKTLKIEKFKFHSSPCKDNYTAWLGGAIYGATDILGMKSISKEHYFREKSLPDWPNMKDNLRTL